MSLPEKLLPSAAKFCSRCQRSIEGPGHLCVGCWNITNYEARTASEKPVKLEPEFKFALIAVDHFRDVTIEQAKKGFEKYGKELDPNDPYDWDDMGEQEVIDLWQYIQCAKHQRKMLLQKLREANETIQQLTEETKALDNHNQILAISCQRAGQERDQLQTILNQIRGYANNLFQGARC